MSGRDAEVIKNKAICVSLSMEHLTHTNSSQKTRVHIAFETRVQPHQLFSPPNMLCLCLSWITGVFPNASMCFLCRNLIKYRCCFVRKFDERNVDIVSHDKACSFQALATDARQLGEYQWKITLTIPWYHLGLAPYMFCWKRDIPLLSVGMELSR